MVSMMFPGLMPRWINVDHPANRQQCSLITRRRGWGNYWLWDRALDDEPQHERQLSELGGECDVGSERKRAAFSF